MASHRLATLPCLPQPHSRPTAIRIDELDAGIFEDAADGLIVDAGELGLAGGQLSATDRGAPDGGGGGELLGAPADQRAGGPDLGAGERLWRHGEQTPSGPLDRVRYLNI